jgi:toxin FitB
MSFLLDTNIVSEWVRPRPDTGVVAWLADVDEDRVFISVVTLAELRYGVECMSDSSRRRRIDEWLQHELPGRFEGRILPVDDAVAHAWGRVVAHRKSIGRRIEPMDALIAATALVHDLTVVTRDASAFKASVKSVNPWTQTST